MNHPNEYPGKVFVPYEATMPVETSQSISDFSSNREGIQGVEPFHENVSLSEENRLDHGTEEFQAVIALGKVSTEPRAVLEQLELPEVDLGQPDALGLWN